MSFIDTYQELSHSCEEERTVGFEGPEKRFEIDFRPSGATEALGLRSISREQWQEMLDLAKCTILNVSKNEFFDAFVLSESSLFVYPYRIMIKTCGTTTLLRCVNKMLDYASNCSLKTEFVRYSRKNFLFPDEQHFPHISWDDEVQYLNDIFDIGQSHVLRGKNAEPWYLYMADLTENGNLGKERVERKTLEIMMHRLEVDAAQQFYKKEGVDDRDKHPAVRNLFNDAMTTDEFNFSPCGYSMNGLEDEVYATIHVTPEPHCSYVSYETNEELTSYSNTIEETFRIFRPGTAQLVIFTEHPNARQESMDDESHPLELSQFEIEGYHIRYSASRSLDSSYNILMIEYESEKHRTRTALRKAKQHQVAY